MNGIMYLIIGLTLIEIVMKIFTRAMNRLRRVSKLREWINSIGAGVTQSEELDSYGRVIDAVELMRLVDYCNEEDCGKIKLNEFISDSS